MWKLFSLQRQSDNTTGFVLKLKLFWEKLKAFVINVEKIFSGNALFN